MNRVLALFGLIWFTSGRRLSAYNQLLPVAQARNQPALVAHIQRARTHELHVRELETRWDAQRTRRAAYPAELPHIDRLTDQTLTGMRDVAQAQARGMAIADPLQETAKTFVTTLFPAGPDAITSLPYIEQVAAVEVIVDKLQTTLAPAVVELGLQRKVTHLVDLLARYREAVDRSQPLAFATVRAARERGQCYLAEIIAMIIAAYHDADNPAHVAARDELLAPVIAHKNALHAKRRARRGGQRADLDADLIDEPGDLDDPADLDGEENLDGEGTDAPPQNDAPPAVTELAG